MRTLIAFSAVLFSIEGAELVQLVAAFFIAVEQKTSTNNLGEYGNGWEGSYPVV